jgi:hypothetical protein
MENTNRHCERELVTSEKELAGAYDPEALAAYREHFTDAELVTLLQEQRREVASLASKRERVEVDGKIADTILAPLQKATDARGAATLARLFASLLFVNRTTGIVRGGGYDFDDVYVYREAARLSGVPFSEAMALPEDVRKRMRALT